MAAYAHLKNEITEDEKYHNLMRKLKYLPGDNKTMVVMIRAQTTTITSKAIANPRQFLFWVVCPTNSCK